MNITQFSSLEEEKEIDELMQELCCFDTKEKINKAIVTLTRELPAMHVDNPSRHILCHLETILHEVEEMEDHAERAGVVFEDNLPTAGGSNPVGASFNPNDIFDMANKMNEVQTNIIREAK